MAEALTSETIRDGLHYKLDEALDEHWEAKDDAITVTLTYTPMHVEVGE